MSGPGLRLLVWADTLPAVYPPDAVLERVPWATLPEHVASRAKGLAAHAIAVLPPSTCAEAAPALAALRRHTSLPLWLVAAERPPGDLMATLDPISVLARLDPKTVAGALTGMASGAAGPVRANEPVIVVFAPSGGAGASTIAVALAETLCAWHVPTVLVDFNLHAPTLAVLLETWGTAEASPTLEQYLRDPATPAVPVPGRGGLRLVPGLEVLENLDDVGVAKAVAILESLRGSARVVDTAPVVTDPAVYAALRSASHTVLVSDDRVSSRLQLKRYRRLFLQLGLGWCGALLVLNRSRPASGGVTASQMEEEVGLRPVATLPYRSAAGATGPGGRADGAWRGGIEQVGATILGREPRRPPMPWRPTRKAR